MSTASEDAVADVTSGGTATYCLKRSLTLSTVRDNIMNRQVNEKAHGARLEGWMSRDSLEAALRDYGPSAIDDLLPRLRVIADALDDAHRGGRVHGSLHPQSIFVAADNTHVTGLGAEGGAAAETAVRPPYAAPEVVAGGAATAASDQFALAAIAYEWLFGRRISGPAARPVDVRTLPGVDRDAMSTVFTRALAPEAADRFASCMAFCNALAATVIPVLPLGTTNEDEVRDEGFLPEPAPIHREVDSVGVESSVEPELLIEEPRFAAFEPQWSPPVEPVPSWQPSAAYTPAPKPADRFSGGMLIAATLVGMVVGFAAGYMARPRALQSGPVQSMNTSLNGTEGAVAGAPPSAPAPFDAGNAGVARGTPAPVAPTSAPQAPEAPSSNIGRLLIRSTPSGASVDVDGAARGLTPLALRDLAFGSRTIAVARRGYIAEQRRVVLTRARPSRSLEIRLTATAAAAPRSASAAVGRSGAAGAATGILSVESRPAGAAVLIDGKPRGVTPATIEGLAPGDYRVNLSLAGYQPFAATVRVVAGERTRAAASLSVQE